MSRRSRIVIDTNVYLSHVLNLYSVPSRAILRAMNSAEILISSAIAAEIVEVVNRPKFDRYVRPAIRQATLSKILSIATLVEPSLSVRACRDPRDDKFLELAVDGRADLILSGDRDLLVLSPFRGISVVTPTQYLTED